MKFPEELLIIHLYGTDCNVLENALSRRNVVSLKIIEDGVEAYRCLNMPNMPGMWAEHWIAR